MAIQTNDWRTKSAIQTRLAFGQALLELAAKLCQNDAG